jgi:hypothetical protein
MRFDGATTTQLEISYNLAVNTWYYVALRCVADSTAVFCLYDANGELLGSQTASAFFTTLGTMVHPCIGGIGG